MGQFEPSDSVFKTAITKVRAGDFDSLYVCLFPGQVGTFFAEVEGAVRGVGLSVMGTS